MYVMSMSVVLEVVLLSQRSTLLVIYTCSGCLIAHSPLHDIISEWQTDVLVPARSVLAKQNPSRLCHGSTIFGIRAIQGKSNDDERKTMNDNPFAGMP